MLPFVVVLLVFVIVAWRRLRPSRLLDERTAQARILRDRLANVDKAG